MKITTTPRKLLWLPVNIITFPIKLWLVIISQPFIYIFGEIHAYRTKGLTRCIHCGSAYREIERKKDETKVVILDNNPLSIASYAEEYPENWKKMLKDGTNK